MSYLRSIKVRNGDYYELAHYYKCNNCGKQLFEADNDYDDGNGYDLCPECAFKLGRFSEKQFLNSIGLDCGMFHAAINDNEIVIWQGKPIPPFKRSNIQQRKTVIYAKWRTSVFKRDNYTCQDCGVKGGDLNAHHLKEYAVHKKLRHVLSNGITLCEGCHRLRHKKKVT